MDLLPRDAEVARRAAGGDGAAFVRLYDLYSEEIFEASLAASGSIETAAKATQTAFLRILRRPPALDAPDGEVAARLRRLVPDGPIDPAPATNGGPHPRASDVGWLRSETVAMAGARFDDDWSVHLWTQPPAAEPEEEQPDIPAEPASSRRRFALPRLRLPSPAAAIALVGLALVGGALGLLTGSGQDASGTAPSERSLQQHTARAGDQAAAATRPGIGTKTRVLAMKCHKKATGSC